MNRAILLGNLGSDVDLKFLAEGTPIAKFSLATNKYSSKDKKEAVTWHNIVVWGKPAEVCAKYLTKGSKVLVEGEIVNRSYEDKTGAKKYISEVQTWSHVEFVGAKKEHTETAFQQSTDDIDNIPF